MSLSVLAEKIKGVKVLVIGDAMLDTYITGNATRLSPEAPVPVVLKSGEEWRAGGAANVAINAAALGAQVTLIAGIGNDLAGERLKSVLSSYNVVLSTINIPTISKTRVVANGQQIIRIDEEDDGFLLSDSDFISLGDKIIEEVTKTDILLFSDYGKGILTQSLFDLAKTKAQELGKFISVDPKPSSGISYCCGVNILKPNRKEALELANIPRTVDDSFLPLICKDLHNFYNPKLLVITLGEKGLLFSRAGQPITIYPSKARAVADVSGAGDCASVALSISLFLGEKDVDAANFTNIVAGIAVSRRGTAIVTINDVLNWKD